MEYFSDYIEKNIAFAKKQVDKLGLHGYETYKRMWINLAEELNKRGKEKTVDKWKRVSANRYYIESTQYFK